MGTGPIAAVRALHFAAAIVAFGPFAYLAVVAPQRAMPRAFARALTLSALALVVTLAAWLALEAISMSGLAPREALGASTLEVVATQTLFGRVWIARFVLALVLLALALFLEREPAHRAALGAGGMVAGLLVATIAGTGHALAGAGIDRAVHLCADALHLIAAGAWLGALVPLIAMLSRPADLPLAARLAQRFSTLGVACLAAIVLSGVVNACYMLPDVGALAASQYGRLLLAKIVLFLLIFALAAFNRVVLTPRLAATSGSGALRRLRTTAIVECVLGFGIVAVVGQLGITMPQFHHH